MTRPTPVEVVRFLSFPVKPRGWTGKERKLLDSTTPRVSFPVTLDPRVWGERKGN